MIDLSALYRNWGEWEDAYCKLADRLAALLNLRGTPLTQGHQLLERYRKACDLWELQGRLYCYAKLQRDADAREETAGGAFQRLAQKLADMEAETAWFAADIAQVPQATLLDWCMQTPDLQAYEVPALEIHRSRAHRLDEASERLIARAEPALRGTLRAYEALSTHVASQWTVELCDGSAVQLTPAKYRELLEHDPEQENRRRASEGCHQRYIEQGPAFAALYAGILQKDFFHSKSRSFPSCLAAATFRDAIPESCVRALIVETRSIRSVFQRYLKLRKRLLRVSEYHLYDNSVRLYCPERALSANLDMPQVICDSVALMGSIYSRNLSDLFEKGCIDYLDRSGKARGAYCLSAYGVPPFIIASLTPSLTSAQTLAHECGHAMHALLADSHQPFQTATYSPIVSESVALTHERFLIRHLDSLVVADDQRSALCLRVLDTAFTSFFTQVMFLDFEVQAHALIECGEAATEEALCDLYARIANQYFAGAVEIDDFYRWTWARVGHFFRSPFYSASYALSFVASAKLFKGMTTGTAAEQELARIRFIDMLQSGGSRAPFELFEAAGVSVDIAGTIAAVAEEVEEQLRCFHD